MTSALPSEISRAGNDHNHVLENVVPLKRVAFFVNGLIRCQNYNFRIRVGFLDKRHVVVTFCVFGRFSPFLDFKETNVLSLHLHAVLFVAMSIFVTINTGCL